MAGDPNLDGSGPFRVAPASGLDPDELWSWLTWYTRFRAVVPLFLLPLGYLVHRQLSTEYDVGILLVIAAGTIPITLGSLVLLGRWRTARTQHAVALERLASVHTIWDTLTTCLAVHFAGGADGPFWPFPLVPTIVAAALLPNGRSVALHAAIAIAAVSTSAWFHGPGHVPPTILLSVMFLGFSAFITSAVSRRLAGQRAQRRMLDYLRAEKTLVEAVARRREEILSVVSHELASPLTALRGYVRLLKEAKGRDRSNDHLFDRIDRQVARLSSLADDLLAMASSSAGALRLQRARFDLVGQLAEVVEASRLQWPEATISLSGVAEAHGAWDRDRLDQLFGNFVSNAMKFAGARCRLELDVQKEEGGQVHIRISDDGPGISADALRRIFEPFQRYSAERGGLGLGLAIARTIVELHGGRVWAESPDGKGALFHVVLPNEAPPGQPLMTAGLERGLIQEEA